ncbi:TIGR01244 family sulfur transferase [Brevundimonas sp. NPDC092305]|uniref:TIGR01244 family sulfur transferase n=1 Tax=Brevundimonas sp. NPDC092305 TaxID=3363957 RepID=UPI0038285602
MATLGNHITDRIFASPQVTERQIACLREEGISVVVNHRPDGEEAGQPTSESLADAAAQHGLKYVHAPVSGLPNAAAVQATREVLDALGPDDRALFFCRSGMRSTAAWAMAESLRGADPDELRSLARAAGYDLDRLPL